MEKKSKINFIPNKNFILKRNSLLGRERLLKIINQSDKVIVHEGFAVNYHKPTIKEEVKNISRNENTSKIELFQNIYPFIYTVSRRRVLNHSSSLLPCILNYSKNKVINDEDDIEKKIIYKDYMMKKRLEKIKKFKTLDMESGKKTQQAEGISPHMGVQMSKNMKNVKNGKIRKALKSHDINFFNQTHYLKNPSLDNYCCNSYKIKTLYKEGQFFDKIKSDVVKLKYDHCLYGYMNDK